jgi:hypothetical protein
MRSSASEQNVCAVLRPSKMWAVISLTAGRGSYFIEMRHHFKCSDSRVVLNSKTIFLQGTRVNVRKRD